MEEIQGGLKSLWGESITTVSEGCPARFSRNASSLPQVPPRWLSRPSVTPACPAHARTRALAIMTPLRCTGVSAPAAIR